MSRASFHDHAERVLRNSKLRYTKKRHRIVELLVEAGRPVKLPELLAENPEQSQSSLYRNLDILVQVGLVARLPGRGHDSFELAGALVERHHHLICDSCDLMTDVQLDAAFERSIEEVFNRVAERSGFSPERHRIDLHGHCANCAAPDS